MNEITIKLCAEDRARLDRLAEYLEKLLPPVVTFDLAASSAKIQPEAAEPVKVPAETKPQEKAPEKAQETAPAAEPTVTLEQIQQKVVQLAAGNGGAKKAKVREIISAYGAKVSDLKEQPEKWTEVWDKLVALEREV